MGEAPEFAGRGSEVKLVRINNAARCQVNYRPVNNAQTRQSHASKPVMYVRVYTRLLFTFEMSFFQGMLDRTEIRAVV